MEPIGLGTLYTTPRRIGNLGNVSPLWLGDVMTHAGDTRMYLKKPLSDNEILAECICSVIGRDYGLPIPRTFLVSDPDQVLGLPVLLGSEDENLPSLRQILNGDLDAAIVALGKWKGIHGAAAFDEWIANPDRNTGNLLWDSEDSWILIDHARSFGEWQDGDPIAAPDAKFINQLASVVAHNEKDMGIARIKKIMSEMFGGFKEKDMESIKNASQCNLFPFPDRCESALSFLVNRITHLSGLISSHGQQRDMFHEH